MHENIQQLQSLFNRLKTRKLLQGTVDTALLCILLLEIVSIFILFLYGIGIIGLIFMLRLMLFAAIIVTIFGLLFKSDLRNLPESADLHYGLKDRLLAASSVLDQLDTTPMERLLVCDAAFHARQVDPHDVFPRRLPRRLRSACGLSLVLFIAGFLVFSHKFQNGPVPLAETLGKRLDEELLRPLERLTWEHPAEKSLQESVDHLRSLRNRMEQTSTNFRETLATLSQMEQALAQVNRTFSSEVMEVSLAEIGVALSTARATQNLGSALQKCNFALASKKLASLEWNTLTRPERETISHALQETAEKIGQRNLSQLSRLMEQLAYDLLHGTLEEIQATVAELAEIVQTENRHRSIHRLLEGKLAVLEEQKTDFLAASRGGQGTLPSETPSRSWGAGDAGNPLTSAATKIDTMRQPQYVQGRQGQGPSEIETILSDEGAEETAGQPYSDAYHQSLQVAETALETEPIPLRLRQVIRKYFQMTNDK